MKNLELLQLIPKTLSVPLPQAHLSSASYFISQDTLHQHDFLNNTARQVCPHEFKNAITLKFLQIENKLCIVTNTEIFIFDPSGKNEVHKVGLGHDVAAISWNATEEIVAVVSTNGDVRTYSIDYENPELFERGSSSVEAKVPDTVYVGWGSKETQFRGSQGKLKNQKPVETNPVSDRTPTISWRGNGEMFVVNFWQNDRRQFVVFETPCSPVFKSEECPGLQPPVAWRPTGNMIATIAIADSKQSVVVFEKNGQKRFAFETDFENVEIKELRWSPCAQILTILTRNLSNLSQTLHLFTCSNYKWYKKQALIFQTDNQLLAFDWLESGQFTYTLRVITQQQIATYVFRSVIHTSSGLCAVIDGQTLQLTDFKQSIIPPVKCQLQFRNTSQIHHVCFSDDHVVIVDAENKLTLFDSSLKAVKSIDVRVEGQLPIPLTCHHFVCNDNVIYFAAETTETVLYSLGLVTGDLNFVDVVDQLSHLFICQSKIDTLTSICNDLYVSKSNDFVKQEVTIFDSECYNCCLTSNCILYVNDNRVNGSVNSFAIFGSYLLYTTKLNEFVCLRFDSLSKSEGYKRQIEQGATIVTPIADSPRIVFQLPRGNLETFSCRLISIDILDNLLNTEKWEEAVRFIRLEKLNSNLLFDLNPQRFLSQIDSFIKSVKSINELNTICLEFEEGNVLKTIYKDWGLAEPHTNKIDAIFGAIFDYFDSIDYVHYISTITVINLTFFTLRQALIYFQDLLRRPNLKQKLVDAINILKTYGCDQDKLYTESLLLYDLELAHFVASCCQLDPRIYEPHLNNLKSLTEVERRYEINLYAKKPKVAVLYLLRCPNVTSDTILEFVRNHNVSQVAYEGCHTYSCHFQTVSSAFALDLSRRGFHKEAGLVLKRGRLLEQALVEFKLGLSWREVLDVLEELKVESGERVRVIGELVRNLRAKDAAYLYEYHLGDHEGALRVLLKNCSFEKALHVAKRHNRKDLIGSEVVPALKSYKFYLEGTLGHLCETYREYFNRLSLVRKNRIAKFTNEEQEEDSFSDVSSTITRSSKSRYSSLSSRNRRKEQKKKQNLRKGGMFEDIALIRALYLRIREIYGKGEEVRVCCLLLLQESDASYVELKKFYNSYSEIIGNLSKEIQVIWPKHFYSTSEGKSVEELADLENFENLDVEFRTPPNAHLDWKINLF